MSLLQLTNRLISNTTDLLFPPACSFCSQPLDKDRDASPLCLKCRQDFVSDTRSACYRCGYPVGPYAQNEDGCMNCQRRHYRFKRLIRLGVYQDQLRHACIRGKSAGAESLSAALADYLCDQKCAELQSFKLNSVVSVPQHWRHRFTRPHHQANTMGEAIASRMKLAFRKNALKKRLYTKDQSSLPRSKRLENLNRAFRVAKRAKIKGQTILLVDDISTTGTTANECARALRQGGAAAVYVAVIAVVEAAQ